MSETIEQLEKFHRIVVGAAAMEALRSHCHPIPAVVQFSLWGVRLSASELLPNDVIVAFDKENKPVWTGRIG